jgi:hypothetical protein
MAEPGITKIRRRIFNRRQMGKNKQLRTCSKCKAAPAYGKTSAYCRKCATEYCRIRYQTSSNALKYARAYYRANKKRYCEVSMEWHKRNPNYRKEYAQRKRVEAKKLGLERAPS